MPKSTTANEKARRRSCAGDLARKADKVRKRQLRAKTERSTQQPEPDGWGAFLKRYGLDDETA